jgi:aldose sugar dehydrogenase
VNALYWDPPVNPIPAFSMTNWMQAVSIPPVVWLCSVITGCSSPFLTSTAVGGSQSPTPLPTQAAPPTLAAAKPAGTGENFRSSVVVAGLEHPWGMAWLPVGELIGELLITERPGRLRLVREGQLEPTPIAGVPPVLAISQGGLMDVALHPQFASNRWIYLTYAHGTREANRTRVARARLVGNALTDLRVIFEVSQPKTGGQHFGSRLLWLPDGTLLVAIGDGGNPPLQVDGQLSRLQAQNRRSHLGKIIRIRDDGSIPANNPWRNDPNADPAVWSYGHRNIQGLAFDTVNQRVWATEHGSRGGDELNLATVGKNYGWPVVTHSQEYGGGEISSARSRPGMVDPVLVWTPAIAPSGLALYRGDRVPAWNGNLFAGGLVSQDVRRLVLNANGQVQRQQTIAIGQRVRDVRQGPDGWLYVLTDAPNGQLLRLEPSP